MARRVVGGVVLVTGALLLAGCGGGDDEAAPTPSATATSDPSESPSQDASPSATPTAAPPTTASGTPAPEALSRFRCEQQSDGWAAAGYLSNPGKEPVTFQVTVFIGPADGASHDAATLRVADVQPEGSVPFKIPDVPAASGSCHVQVLAVD